MLSPLYATKEDISRGHSDGGKNVGLAIFALRSNLHEIDLNPKERPKLDYCAAGWGTKRPVADGNAYIASTRPHLAVFPEFLRGVPKEDVANLTDHLHRT